MPIVESFLDSPVARALRPAALMGAALFIAAVICLQQQLIPSLLAMSCAVLLIAFSRLRLVNLVLAYIVADSLCQLLKRVIFLFGPQPLTVYYLFQLLPTAVIAAAFATAIFQLRGARFSKAAYWVMGMFALALGATLVSRGGATLFGRLGGVNQSVLPILMFFVGMAAPIRAWPRIAGLMLMLVCVSVPYAIFQFLNGPSLIDRVWAEYTWQRSVGAWKVYMFVSHQTSEFRPYSFYADPLTWGLFLVTALVMVFACVSLGYMKRGWLFVAVPFAVAGLVLCSTRTPAAGLLIALAAYRVLSMRNLRRPMVVMTSMAVGTVAIIMGAQYALGHLSFGATSNRLLARFTTVGTLSARTAAPILFLHALPSHAILGDGAGTSYLAKGTDQTGASGFTEAQYSHNAMVDILLIWGLPGLIVFCVSLYLWTENAVWVTNVAPSNVARGVRWLLALTFGLVMTGMVNGSTFMNCYFFLAMGLVAGQWSEWQKVFVPVGQPREAARDEQFAFSAS